MEIIYRERVCYCFQFKYVQWLVSDLEAALLEARRLFCALSNTDQSGHVGQVMLLWQRTVLQGQDWHVSCCVLRTERNLFLLLCMWVVFFPSASCLESVLLNEDKQKPWALSTNWVVDRNPEIWVQGAVDSVAANGGCLISGCCHYSCMFLCCQLSTVWLLVVRVCGERGVGDPLLSGAGCQRGGAVPAEHCWFRWLCRVPLCTMTHSLPSVWPLRPVAALTLLCQHLELACKFISNETISVCVCK